MIKLLNYIIIFIQFVAEHYVDYDDFSYIKPAFHWGFICAKYVRNLFTWIISIILFPIVLFHIFITSNKRILKIEEDITNHIFNLINGI